MKKLVIQGLVMLAIFFATWLGLAEIDWMSLLKIEKISKSSEEKLGTIFWDFFNKAETEIKNPEVSMTIDSILDKICISNAIDKSKVTIHVVKNDEINAFAFPGGHLIIYSGLIIASENEAEIAGVISHELAHLQMNHVMKKLIKEVGLSVLVSISTGNNGSEIIKEIAKLLSSTAYDRNLEKEADIKASDYLINAKISPLPFANFLSRLGDSQTQIESHLEWISTHPDSKERADYIQSYRKGEPRITQSILSGSAWENLLNNLNN
jgi:predicted Zn-dependent protease